MFVIVMVKESMFQSGTGSESLFRGGLQQSAKQAVQQRRGVESFLDGLNELDRGLRVRGELSHGTHILALLLRTVEPRNAIVQEREEGNSTSPDVDGSAVVSAFDTLFSGEHHLRGVCVARANGGEVGQRVLWVVTDGEAEVAELDNGVRLSGFDEDVFHLEVTVDDLVGVEVGQGGEKLFEDGADGVKGLWSPAGKIEQGAARNEFHDDEH